jgi:hypothetical protein
MGLGSGIRDPESGIRKNLFRMPDTGYWIQGSKRHRSATLVSRFQPSFFRALDPGSETLVIKLTELFLLKAWW